MIAENKSVESDMKLKDKKDNSIYLNENEVSFNNEENIKENEKNQNEMNYYLKELRDICEKISMDRVIEYNIIFYQRLKYIQNIFQFLLIVAIAFILIVVWSVITVILGIFLFKFKCVFMCLYVS